MRFDSVSLTGDWQFRAGDQGEWQTLEVPGCWESLQIPHDWEGPGWYRKTIDIPPTWRAQPGDRFWLRFGAVSYACRVWANAIEIGSHIGAWDAFTLEIPPTILQSPTVEILVQVVKPGGPTYPTNQTTAGFLPYVWGFLFGGIWQEVTLERTGPEGRPERNPPPKRSVEYDGSRLLLNGKPFYPRMALSWGWYPETLHCNPPIEIMRAELENLGALGYNGVKCCLWVPPPAYLDLCDAMGMFVWMELPLWLPQMDADQQRQVYLEYEAIVSQLSHHPCIVIWSLGCELSSTCPADFMERLYARIRRMTEGALLRDNSGGGECYGGSLIENADYYDYHFYCDLPFLRSTFDYFLPRGRQEQPWFFGEFCDADACRDLPALKEAHGGALPWWASDDPARNPQGVRWDMNIVGQWRALEQTMLLQRLEELKEGQRRQTLLHRKFTIEFVRTYREMSGYVVTGLRDTPISTAGMFDDFGAPRYSPEEFTRFNADTVLSLSWHRRRNWVAGGDRPSYIDQWTYTGGDEIVPRIRLSHYGKNPLRVVFGKLELLDSSDNPFMVASLFPEPESFAPGSMETLAEFPILLPDTSRMTQIRMRATLRMRNKQILQNEWPLWLVPKTDWQALPEWAAYDPDERLKGLERVDRRLTWPRVSAEEIPALATCTRLIASRWTAEIAAFARSGGHAFVFVDSGGGLPTTPCPFWREAMKLFEPHPLWEHFPHEGFTDINFFGLGPDCALLSEGLKALLPDAEWRPLLRRVDARTWAVTDYLTEASFPSGGRMMISTLRLHGGLGDQPDGLWRHTAGRHLLASLLRVL